MSTIYFIHCRGLSSNCLSRAAYTLMTVVDFICSPCKLWTVDVQVSILLYAASTGEKIVWVHSMLSGIVNGGDTDVMAFLWCVPALSEYGLICPVVNLWYWNALLLRGFHLHVRREILADACNNKIAMLDSSLYRMLINHLRIIPSFKLVILGFWRNYSILWGVCYQIHMHNALKPTFASWFTMFPKFLLPFSHLEIRNTTQARGSWRHVNRMK